MRKAELAGLQTKSREGARGHPRDVFASEGARPDQAPSEPAGHQRKADAAGGSAALGAASTLGVASTNGSLPRAETQELSGLELQLRLINSRIDTLRQPCGLDQAVDVLRDGLAEIGRTVREAMPRAAVEALEAEVRKLGDRIHQPGTPKSIPRPWPGSSRDWPKCAMPCAHSRRPKA